MPPHRRDRPTTGGPSPSLLLVLLVLLGVALPLSYAQSVPAASETSTTAASNRSRCNVDCSREATHLVCGTDGRTYSNRCEMQRVNCDADDVTAAVHVRHGGRCQEKFRCRAERAHAQEVAKGPAAANIFVPQCKDDGSYAKVQCHAATGYCWCVTPRGQPIRGSSVRNRRPSCKKAAGGGRRRSSVKRGSATPKKQPGNRQGCNQADKIQFKKNLVKIFASDYARMASLSMMPTSSTTDPLVDSAERRAVDWKFTELDQNGNNVLDKKEVKSLRQMVKKIVRPRECAKRFTKFCDLDRNRRIGRNEWTVCFGMGMNKEQTEASGRLDHHNHNHNVHQQQSPQQQPSQHHTKQGPVPPSSFQNKQMTLSIDDDDDDDSKAASDDDDDETVDCLGERQTGLEQQRSSHDGSVYVPECGADGRYARVQCYRTTDYCWCVDQDTGKPIPNTSVRFTRPDCDRLIKADRPIAGCPEKKRAAFIVDFTAFLSSEMNAALNQSEQQQRSPVVHPVDTMATLARWKFEQLDANKNRVLDRKEWKEFRVELKQKNSIRKCGRNFVKFCDDDGDKKITFDEWLECFGVFVERRANTASKGSRRPVGPNPLITYLKND